MSTRTINDMISCICVGPPGSGKTLMLRKIQNMVSIDETTSSVPTVGTSLYKFPLKNNKTVTVREIGGCIAPLWPHYYKSVTEIIFVIDVSNLCQISAAGVLLYSVIAEPKLQNAEILLVLSKIDLSYRQMKNEALHMLQIEKLKKKITQNITVVEFSSITSAGIQDIFNWFETNRRKKTET